MGSPFYFCMRFMDHKLSAKLFFRYDPDFALCSLYTEMERVDSGGNLLIPIRSEFNAGWSIRRSLIFKVLFLGDMVCPALLVHLCPGCR